MPHIVWCLDEPVHRYPAARIDPLRYLAGIAEYYAHAVGADPAYSGVLAHNPAPLFKGPYRTTWGREEPYTLDQLASVIPFNWEPPTVRQTGVGRNVDLFEAGCRWAGRPMNKNLTVLPALMAVNQDFDYPIAAFGGTGDGKINRDVPQTLGGPWLALPALDREASSACSDANRKG